MPTETHDEDSIVPAEVDELLRRRETVVGWLRKLDGLAAEIRSEVHEKVLEDYRTRLSEVDEELTSHAAELEETLEEKRATVAGLEAEREEKAAVLEEAEVRHAVGEFTGEEWEHLREESESDLESLAERLDEERRGLTRLQEVRNELVSLGRDDEPGTEEEARAGTEAVPPEAATPSDEREVAEAAPGGEATGPDAPSAAGSGDAVAGPAARPADPGAGASASDEAVPAEAAPDEGAADELDFLESLALDEPETLDSFAHLLDDDEEEEERGSEGDGG